MRSFWYHALPDPRMSESTMNATVVRRLREIPGCYAVKLGASRYLRAGTPDVLAVYNGHAFLLEGKAPGKHPTPIQRAELLRWGTAGATAAVYRSVAEAVAIVRGEIVSDLRRPAA